MSDPVSEQERFALEREKVRAELKLRERELLGDWSHVRDSTPEALYAARTYIEAALGFKG